MAIVKVTCNICGDITIFTDTVPDNTHITKRASTPDKYTCNSCGNDTDTDREAFKIE